MRRNYNGIGIVTARELVDGRRLDKSMSPEVVKAAQDAAAQEAQIEWL
jgi:hypothetical protein